MSVIWLNGTIGSGKSAVGKALADLLPHARFMDGDNYAGPEYLGNA
jgi:shikimate kinase